MIVIALIISITVIVVVLLSLLRGASFFHNNTSGDPQTCQERAAYKLASAYPDPNDLVIAVDMVCNGNVP